MASDRDGADDLMAVISSFGDAAPPTVPLAVPSASTFSSLMSGGDAETQLVKGVLQHQLVLTSQATKATAFLFAYGLGDYALVCLKLREFHQSPKRLIEALEATSLKKYLQGIAVNVSTSK